jgi:cell pole-organizing protein PopZ
MGDISSEPSMEEILSSIKRIIAEEGDVATGARSRRPAAGVTVKPAPVPLEGLVRELVKPMLRDWLDANLPQIVETMVAREISRITGRN